MWQWILLFIVLTPGVLFTIPPYGKKMAGGLSGKVVTAILHGVVFAAAARFFMLCKEGFQDAQEYRAPCSPGQYSPNGTCVPCPPGTAGEGDDCINCPIGKVPNSTQTACVSRQSMLNLRPQTQCTSGKGGVKNFMGMWGSTCQTCPSTTVRTSVQIGLTSHRCIPN